VGKGYFHYISKRPPCGGLFMRRLFGYATLELVELDDKTIYSLFSIVLIIEYDTIKIWKEYVKCRIAIGPI
jgi:hypothetical protein